MAVFLAALDTASAKCRILLNLLVINGILDYHHNSSPYNFGPLSVFASRLHLDRIMLPARSCGVHSFMGQNKRHFWPQANSSYSEHRFLSRIDYQRC